MIFSPVSLQVTHFSSQLEESQSASACLNAQQRESKTTKTAFVGRRPWRHQEKCIISKIEWWCILGDTLHCINESLGCVTHIGRNCNILEIPAVPPPSIYPGIWPSACPVCTAGAYLHPSVGETQPRQTDVKWKHKQTLQKLNKNKKRIAPDFALC